MFPDLAHLFADRNPNIVMQFSLDMGKIKDELGFE